MTKKANATRSYGMTVAGQMFKHLGLQMYSGAVPAIAELISNAYDAMAKNVWITLPTGRPITDNDEIVVRDDGHGMTFDQANALYLRVGRDRRADASERTQPYNGLPSRKVQGRKGIGKLAGFGVAHRIEVRSVRDKQIQHFALDFDALTKSQEFADTNGYAPETLPEDSRSTKERPGTRVTLAPLKLRRTIDESEFKRGIARRLLVIDASFTVRVNGKTITRDEIPFQFRFPEQARMWNVEDVGGQTIQWWAGFSERTIADEEQRGFVVYVRGKLAQTPWFFGLSGGVHGQHGMQYLTGEVKADFLDEAVDLVATDRGTVRWEDPLSAPLKQWGESKVRELLKTWVERRRTQKTTSPKIKRYVELAAKLPTAEREIFNKVVDRIVSIPQLDKDAQGQDIAEELIEFAYNALTNRAFLDAIRRLNNASPQDMSNFAEVLSEWDIIEAVNTAHLVKGRVEIIRKFKHMIDEGVPEKPDMQEYLKKYPWLIDPALQMLVHEKPLDALLAEKFGQHTRRRGKGGEGSRRVDYFCLGDCHNTAYVVEVKRPGALVGRKEYDQVRDYVLYLRQRLQSSSTASKYSRAIVGGYLIASRFRPDDDEHRRVHSESGTFHIRTWENLLTTTETLHKEFLDVVKGRAPADDPRMKDLESSQLAEATPTSGGARKAGRASLARAKRRKK